MKITIPDKVSSTAAELFKAAKFNVKQKAGIDIDECNSLCKDADAVVVRSYALHELEISTTIKAIGRAGAGVNNIPAMIEKITTVIAQENLNINEMINKSRGEIAYNIVDVNGTITDEAVQKIRDIEGVIRARKLL